MKVLFATTNPAKAKKYKEQLAENSIELITIKDLDEEIDINENGKNALENAYIKAKTYYDKTKIPTIGMDDCLFIEGISEEEQPGTNVRRVNGKRLNDEEMIEYYTKLVKKYGNKLTAKWVYGMVVCTDKGIFKFTWSKDDFYLVDKPIEKRNVGYPLDSISVIPENGKYFAHTLNNTVVAPPRMLIAFLENNLQADGSVRIPEVLRPYMGGMTEIR